METRFLTTFMSNSNIVQLIIGLFICVALSVFLIYKFWKIPMTYIYIITLVSMFLSFYFDAYALGFVLLLFLSVGGYLFFFSNIAGVRSYFIKPRTNSRKGVDKNKEVQENFYKTIDNTVHSLAKSKTGALITFEKETSLDEYIRKGSIINCPVSQEIIETIFYEGTRLHDGAIIIRGTTILAAAVYYQPTESPLDGKFGARHRAGLGMAEANDSVTVIVSEETGRVSIAHNGKLNRVALDSFYDNFVSYMKGKDNN